MNRTRTALLSLAVITAVALPVRAGATIQFDEATPTTVPGPVVNPAVGPLPDEFTVATTVVDPPPMPEVNPGVGSLPGDFTADPCDPVTGDNCAPPDDGDGDGDPCAEADNCVVGDGCATPLAAPGDCDDPGHPEPGANPEPGGSLEPNFTG